MRKWIPMALLLFLVNSANALEIDSKIYYYSTGQTVGSCVGECTFTVGAVSPSIGGSIGYYFQPLPVDVGVVFYYSEGPGLSISLKKKIKRIELEVAVGKQLSTIKTLFGSGYNGNPSGRTIANVLSTGLSYYYTESAAVSFRYLISSGVYGADVGKQTGVDGSGDPIYTPVRADVSVDRQQFWIGFGYTF